MSDVETDLEAYRQIPEPACRGFQDALELVGRRWTGAILLAAVRGARRFGEYRAAVAGISDRLLAARLKELEADGLIERSVIPSTPVQIRYTPTEQGRQLMAALQPLITWSHRRTHRSR
ncbi:winged helix-turn-helix transcriptional regulator [Verrucosispora sp. WMMD703]|uniref:winged helix-turn-helix transcriptional regulator n=1 Tax=unclassified Micromonospora TaxID=2617518 RepID=UPI00249BD4E2|nr:helix-turn-helix domain-containing protein [Verrucosispora sp. WMMD1129]WFE46879.1 helix-turn-helix domain-containing protein [Verrucosispora sp. WMMD1129]